MSHAHHQVLEFRQWLLFFHLELARCLRFYEFGLVLSFSPEGIAVDGKGVRFGLQVALLAVIFLIKVHIIGCKIK